MQRLATKSLTTQNDTRKRTMYDIAVDAATYPTAITFNAELLCQPPHFKRSPLICTELEVTSAWASSQIGSCGFRGYLKASMKELTGLDASLLMKVQPFTEFVWRQSTHAAGCHLGQES
eukprot:3475149-Amphidinium_carterae.1